MAAICYFKIQKTLGVKYLITIQGMEHESMKLFTAYNMAILVMWMKNSMDYLLVLYTTPNTPNIVGHCNYERPQQ
jgi:hypothetical protein